MHALAVGGSRAGGETRTQARADLVPQAAWRTRSWKKFPLIGKDHLLMARTIPQTKMIVEPANRFTQALAGKQRPVRGHHSGGREPRQEELGRRLAAHAEIGRSLPGGFASHIEVRPPAANQFQLANEGSKLMQA